MVQKTRFSDIPSVGYVQRDSGGLAQSYVDLDLGSSPGWWATTFG